MEHRYTFLFFCFIVVHIPRWDTHFCQKMPPKSRSKTTVKSPHSRSDAVEAINEGRVPTLVEQIENLMNSLVRLLGNPSNTPIALVEGRDAGNVDLSILFFNNSNEFQAAMQEIKSR